MFLRQAGAKCTPCLPHLKSKISSYKPPNAKRPENMKIWLKDSTLRIFLLRPIKETSSMKSFKGRNGQESGKGEEIFCCYSGYSFPLWLITLAWKRTNLRQSLWFFIVAVAIPGDGPNVDKWNGNLVPIGNVFHGSNRQKVLPLFIAKYGNRVWCAGVLDLGHDGKYPKSISWQIEPIGSSNTFNHIGRYSVRKSTL